MFALCKVYELAATLINCSLRKGAENHKPSSLTKVFSENLASSFLVSCVNSEEVLPRPGR